jgi:hypothetical protein
MEGWAEFTHNTSFLSISFVPVIVPGANVLYNLGFGSNIISMKPSLAILKTAVEIIALPYPLLCSLFSYFIACAIC